MINASTISDACGPMRSRYLRKYCQYLASVKVCTNTRIAYAQQVSKFLCWLDETNLADVWLSEPDMRENIVNQYKQFMKLEKRVKRGTVNAALTAIGSFCRFLGVDEPKIEREHD